MSGIRKKWSEIDCLAHSFLKGYKIRHQMYPAIAGSPDVLVHPDVVVFVDGCFWHKCPRCYRPPKSRRGYWIAKIDGNRKRDAALTRRLKEEGWTVVRIWEHAIREEPRALISRLAQAAGRRTNRQKSG